VVQPG